MFEISPEYDECPFWCTLLSQNRQTKGFCHGCEIKIKKQFFEEETLKELQLKVKDEWQQYGFSYLIEMVNLTVEAEDIPKEERTVLSDFMIDILQSQRNLQRKIEYYNRKKNQNNDGD